MQGSSVKAVRDHAFLSLTLFQNGAKNSSVKKHILSPKKFHSVIFAFYQTPK